MTATKATSTDADDPRTGLTSTVIRWGGLAAAVGPLLVLSANIYGLWETQAYGSSPEATV